MFTTAKQSVLILIVLTVVTGVVYPLAVTGIAQLIFPHQANGSLIVKGGKAVGSELIGQPFTDAKYFWSRPSATVSAEDANQSVPYNAANSGGSNLGPLNPTLVDNVKNRVGRLRSLDPASRPAVPVDLVTSSASGLDPDITVAAAEFQIARVARARGVSEEKVRELVFRITRGRQFGVLGEPRVNVLKLNLALDEPQK